MTFIHRHIFCFEELYYTRRHNFSLWKPFQLCFYQCLRQKSDMIISASPVVQQILYKPGVTWTSLSSSDHEADFNKLFKNLKTIFIRDFLGNAVYPGDLTQFIVLTHSVISSGAGKSLQLMIGIHMQGKKCGLDFLKQLKEWDVDLFPPAWDTWSLLFTGVCMLHLVFCWFLLDQTLFEVNRLRNGCFAVLA